MGKLCRKCATVCPATSRHETKNPFNYYSFNSTNSARWFTSSNRRLSRTMCQQGSRRRVWNGGCVELPVGVRPPAVLLLRVSVSLSHLGSAPVAAHRHRPAPVPDLRRPHCCCCCCCCTRAQVCTSCQLSTKNASLARCVHGPVFQIVFPINPVRPTSWPSYKPRGISRDVFIYFFPPKS